MVLSNVFGVPGVMTSLHTLLIVRKSEPRSSSPRCTPKIPGDPSGAVPPGMFPDVATIRSARRYQTNSPVKGEDTYNPLVLNVPLSDVALGLVIHKASSMMWKPFDDLGSIFR